MVLAALVHTRSVFAAELALFSGATSALVVNARVDRHLPNTSETLSTIKTGTRVFVRDLDIAHLRLCTGIILAAALRDALSVLATKLALLSPTAAALLLHAGLHALFSLSVRTHGRWCGRVPVLLTALMDTLRILSAKLALLATTSTALVLNARCCILSSI